jgi:cytochrome oxidase Cu insertion factor (SCO1/SenC/PrrC family)
MNEVKKKGSYAPLWILLALSAFPYIAGTLYFQFRDSLPVNSNNYGELVQPAREIPHIEITQSDGTVKKLSDYEKKWLMLYVLDRRCEEDCRKNLYYMRQIRKAMAQDRFRINRLLLVEGASGIDAELQQLMADYPGVDIATVNPQSKQSFYAVLKDEGQNNFGKILLIDPMGNYMMKYDPQPDPEKVLKDIKKLLSISRIG